VLNQNAFSINGPKSLQIYATPDVHHPLSNPSGRDVTHTKKESEKIMRGSYVDLVSSVLKTTMGVLATKVTFH
jgi:hypothetical protein